MTAINHHLAALQDALSGAGFAHRFLPGGGADLLNSAFSLGRCRLPAWQGWDVLADYDDETDSGYDVFLRRFDDNEGAWQIAELEAVLGYCAESRVNVNPEDLLPILQVLLRAQD